MSKSKKAGIAFHLHHYQLWEYCYDYDERVAYIKATKPEHEQKLRLRLFRLIPEDRLPGRDSPEWADYDKAREAHYKAWKDFAKACEAYNEACGAYYEAWAYYGKAREAYNEAWTDYNKAREDYNEASEAYNKAYSKEIEALHRELCPNCSWDGKTIFPKKAK